MHIYQRLFERLDVNYIRDETSSETLGLPQLVKHYEPHWSANFLYHASIAAIELAGRVNGIGVPISPVESVLGMVND